MRDALRRDMKPLYNYLDDLPALEGAPPPVLPSAQIRRTAGAVTSFDAGRGCPFQCSFCTIINVQGRKSRWRGADDVEHIVRENAAQGISSFFITDDNFARNLEWEPILDRLIELRERDGLHIKLTIQVDLLCHKIKGFIDKCIRAGTKRVFLGLESINPEALAGAKKRQNQIGEYREMLQAWHTTGVTTCAGYILGFPTDTPESIVRDIRIIQRELPIDILEFFVLTPLPGSEDHQKLYEKGVWMDPDMNKYDSTHVTTAHPLMTPEEWEKIYYLAWETYYTPEHMETVLRRARGAGISRRRDALIWFSCSISVENVHPLDGGYFRLKYRRDRRPGMSIESPLIFYPRRVWDLLWGHARILALAWKLDRLCRQIKNDPKSREYTDLSLTPVTENERYELELFTQTPSARAAAGHHAGDTSSPSGSLTFGSS